ncbi:MAG: hypothetical protein K0S12_2181, partial [Bacteroidetes bacterium]|nr:hypothetical protein [Bacteroidota bacterium]
MSKEYNYVTKLDIKFKHLEKIDVPKMVEENPHKWF